MTLDVRSTGLLTYATVLIPIQLTRSWSSTAQCLYTIPGPRLKRHRRRDDNKDRRHRNSSLRVPMTSGRSSR